MSRRRFLVHSAHSTIGVSAGLAAFRAAGQGRTRAAERPSTRRPLEVCLVSGSLEYRSDESLGVLEEHLGRHYGIRCTRAFMKNEHDLPGLENLDRCDCMVLFTRRLTLPAEQLERVKRYCSRGGPIVGIRTASHAFQNWLELDKEVFGGDYRGHYGNQQKPRISIRPEAKDHPILDGFKPFVSEGSLYKNPQIAADTNVLLVGTIPGHTEPVAWTRLHRGGRVFYTSLGHPADFQQASFLRLLAGAVFWTTGSGRETGRGG
ncbi:MAG: ThuA domain-containing protein [Thermoguttaceae bacterium]